MRATMVAGCTITMTTLTRRGLLVRAQRQAAALDGRFSCIDTSHAAVRKQNRASRRIRLTRPGRSGHAGDPISARDATPPPMEFETALDPDPCHLAGERVAVGPSSVDTHEPAS